MSWITIAVFAILILFGVSGWRKGIIRTAVSLAAMVVTFIVCVWVVESFRRKPVANKGYRRKLFGIDCRSGQKSLGGY